MTNQAQALADARMAMFLEIMDAAGGETDAGDWRWNWINAFCEEHEGRYPDTFNAAANAGYISVSHCTSTDHSVATLTDKGRDALATYDAGSQKMDPVSVALEAYDDLRRYIYDTDAKRREWSIDRFSEKIAAIRSLGSQS